MEERFYAEYAEIQDRHWWFAGRRRIVASVLGEALPARLSGSTRILDVGCGTGVMLEELRRFGEVVGVDSEPAAVAFCRRRGEDRVELATGAELPFSDAAFDVVTLLDVIEHIDEEETMLAEVRRVLAPSGVLLVTVPAYTWMWGPQDEISHHRRRYTRRRLLDSLSRAGFQTSRSSYFNTLLLPPIAAIRLARRLFPAPEELRSDFELNQPGRLNSALTRVFGWEARLLQRVNFPFGVSILALAHPGP